MPVPMLDPTQTVNTFCIELSIAFTTCSLAGSEASTGGDYAEFRPYSQVWAGLKLSAKMSSGKNEEGREGSGRGRGRERREERSCDCKIWVLGEFHLKCSPLQAKDILTFLGDAKIRKKFPYHSP